MHFHDIDMSKRSQQQEPDPHKRRKSDEGVQQEITAEGFESDSPAIPEQGPSSEPDILEESHPGMSDNTPGAIDRFNYEKHSTSLRQRTSLDSSKSETHFSAGPTTSSGQNPSEKNPCTSSSQVGLISGSSKPAFTFEEDTTDFARIDRPFSISEAGLSPIVPGTSSVSKLDQDVSLSKTEASLNRPAAKPPLDSRTDTEPNTSSFQRRNSGDEAVHSSRKINIPTDSDKASASPISRPDSPSDQHQRNISIENDMLNYASELTGKK